VDDFESESNDPVEMAADHMAQEALIPASEWRDVQAHGGALTPKVHDVARRLRIHPAIVAGRLRRERHDYRILSRIIGQGKMRDLFS
jgi:HTH-type transcriptional regulator/antitoxin HigA